MILQEDEDKFPAWYTSVSDICLALPFRIATAAVTFPFQYIGAQFRQIYDRGLHYLPDTLSQIPMVKIPFRAVDEGIFERQLHWGERHKGIFNMGSAYESIARPDAATYVTEDITQLESSKNHVCKSPVIYVDASSHVRHGLLGQDLDGGFSVVITGSLDPVGSHTDIYQGPIYELIAKVLLDRIQINKKISADKCEIATS
ncbi:MAG: hypothetical protein P0120_21500 [Nitrospira sp.]|nr:hypothetical protein [Nitrospira sp.]